jgi:hypothetical protein
MCEECSVYLYADDVQLYFVGINKSGLNHMVFGKFFGLKSGQDPVFPNESACELLKWILLF